jgi:proteic killer suppression protein
VIVSFAHKGLEQFYLTGSTAGIQAIHAKRLKLILAVLDAADSIEGIRLPSLNLHRLKGTKKDLWAVTVQANWRVTFRFVNGNAEIVNYEDYH